MFWTIIESIIVWNKNWNNQAVLLCPFFEWLHNEPIFLVHLDSWINFKIAYSWNPYQKIKSILHWLQINYNSFWMNHWNWNKTTCKTKIQNPTIISHFARTMNLCAVWNMFWEKRWKKNFARKRWVERTTQGTTERVKQDSILFIILLTFS